MKEEITKQVEYQNDNFLITKYEYNLQFYPYYNARYNAMKESLQKSATTMWPSTPIHHLSDLADNDDDEEESESGSQPSRIDEEILQGKELVVLGTLFKKMPCQPNILKELDDEKKMIAQADDDQSNFVSAEDIIYLQDGDESIELKGEGMKINELCTGICVAVKGHINLHGSGFIVDDICFASIDQIERPPQAKDYHVVIVSGLGFAKNMSQNQPLTRSLNLLFDILSGNSSFVVNKPIVNLIIAGNCIGKSARGEEKEADADKKTPAWNKKIRSYTIDAVKLLDKFLANVGQFVSIDVMPGVLDPCNFLWPQQPLHPCLLPNAYRLETLRSVPNPHRAKYFGVDFLGTSGQNIDSIRACTSASESTEIMRKVMEWGHIAPTCPDLLHGYPFKDKDPLVLTSYPDVFFAGNQSDFSVGSFESPAGKKVQLVSVPTFEDKMIAVLVNLRTLNCEMLAFN